MIKDLQHVLTPYFQLVQLWIFRFGFFLEKWLVVFIQHRAGNHVGTLGSSGELRQRADDGGSAAAEAAMLAGM